MSSFSRTAETRRCGFLANSKLPGEDAIIRKEGERLIIKPAPPKSLLALLATLAPLDEDFPQISDPPPEPVEF